MNKNLKKRLASLGVAAGIAVSSGTVTSFRAGERDITSDTSYVQDVDTDVSSNSNVNVSSERKVDSPINTVDLISDASLSDRFVNISPESFSVFNDMGSNVTTNVAGIGSQSSTISTSPVTKLSDLSVENRNNDSDNYELMKDAIAYSFSRFNSENESLSSALESTYGIELSAEQRARYDTIMKDTHDAYNRAIDAYKSGDMDTFKSICDDILKNKKYLNLDDLVDILSIAINLQGDYIKDSSNYSIVDGKLIIDGVTVSSMFSDAKYVDQSDVMSLIQFYDKKDDSNVLDLMQVPVFVAKQATNPTNLTLVEDSKNGLSVYTYDEAKLKMKFADIKNEYDSKLGDSKNDDAGYKYFNDMLNQYYTSYGCRVGYFSGSDMKDFLKQYENGIENIKIPDEIEYIGIGLWDAYNLMHDANGYAFDRFNSNYSSLTDALESTYGVKLSAEQRARYDTIMKDTSDIYKKGIELYKSGHVAEFRKICDDILKKKKYLNLDDLVDIISMNINSQEVVINNSKDYTISPGKLEIDGITIQSLFTLPSYVDQKDVMSLVDMYNGCDEDDLRVLDIMQVPIFVSKQAINPCNFTMLNNNSVYSYNSDELGKKFDEIENHYKDAEGIRNFSTDFINGEVVLIGYDENSNKVDLSNSMLKDEEMQLYQYINQYRRSNGAQVGYFDGAQMKSFLAQYDDGYDNIKVSSVDNSVGFAEFESYSLMSDSIGFVFNGFNSSYSSLTEALESTYNIELSADQKSRYDTIVEDTQDAYQRGIDAYKKGHVGEFRKICDEILKEKKYLNIDDVVDIISININSQGNIIGDSSNYSLSGDKLIIDNCVVEKLFADDYSDVMGYFELYNGSNEDTLRTIDIMRAPKQAILEAINPTCFSLMVDGVVYSYNKDRFNSKFNDLNNYFENNLGLSNFEMERNTDGSSLIYGFDSDNNKHYIDSDNEYNMALSRYLSIVKPAYEKSKDSYIGYFDGPILRDLVENIENNTMSKTR